MNKLQQMSGYCKLVRAQSLRRRSQKRQRKGTHQFPTRQLAVKTKLVFARIPSGGPAKKLKTPVEDFLLRFTFRSPTTVAVLSIRLANTERLDHTLGSRIGSATATDLTITFNSK